MKTNPVIEKIRNIKGACCYKFLNHSTRVSTKKHFRNLLIEMHKKMNSFWNKLAKLQNCTDINGEIYVEKSCFGDK